MKLRTLIIVAVALAIVTMAGYYIRNASLITPEDDPLVGTKILDSGILAGVKRIEISKDGSKAILESTGESGWVVRSLYDLPADFAKLNTLVRSLVDATIVRKITSREDRMARLDLTQGTVKLMSGPEKTLLDITFGKSLSDSGKAFILGRGKTAFQASTSPNADANSNNWAVKTLYEFKADDVAGIQFFLSEDTWGVRRDDKDKDFVSTIPVDKHAPKQSAIKSLINRFTNLRFVEVSERPTEQATETWKAAQENVRTIKFTLFSGEIITIKMSQYEPPKPEGDAVAPNSGPSSATYINISDSKTEHPINKLMNRLAFKASSYTYTGIPKEFSEVADIPEPEAAKETATQPAQAENPGQPEIKQHVDGNSVIFEVNQPKKEEAGTTEPK